MIDIDGSYGEGGGQILRTALALSCLQQRPFRIHSIRKGRRKPGLMPQHLVAVRAAGQVASAEVSGDEKGSTELTFVPRRLAGGDFEFDIGTAGSTSLVLQTIIPALLFARGASSVTLKGGTHVPFSPSFHYLAEVFAPMLARLGLDIRLDIHAYGFYPRGGGEVRARIVPAREVTPLNLEARGKVLAVRGVAAVGNLPRHIAERERESALGVLREGLGEPPFPVDIHLAEAKTPGQGAFIFLRLAAEHGGGGFAALGERGKRAETVGAEAAEELLAYFRTAAALDPHLADQLVLYLALARGESAFTTSAITRHLLTNLWVVGLFQPFAFRVEGEEGRPGRVVISGSSWRGGES